ncbi:hypothetical protein ZIOFF_063556 [Zingiber officinale]|uniref:Myb-like domain-containing protein n=1 Tax=Zingiber officinale TaxID=94328 RepID=A0A8J5F2B3_ZINOF|nr:hypothetical protein ZIOFF_063556 [Zingiber officinale]
MVTENDPTPVAPAVVAPAKKDWHEDDLLREHIALHGIDSSCTDLSFVGSGCSWTSLSALFKDKSSRQCRRRWYTYLNSECKKAQKMFGNRWMEIAKVVSGRTDNAVNSFSVLCKKRAKIEVSSKENRVPSLYPSTKRVLVGEPSTSNEQMRYHISPLKNTSGAHRTSLGEHGPAQHLQRSLLLAVQVFDTANRSLSDMGVYQYDASNKVSQVTFLRKDDQKLTALLQQSELLTSLSKKVNAENNNQSFDEAWKVLNSAVKYYSGLLEKKFSGMSCMLDELRDLQEDLQNSSEEEKPPLRQVGSHENTQGNSECSTSSMHNVNARQSRSYLQFEDCSMHKDNEVNHQNVDAACSNMHSYPELNLSFSGKSKDEVEDGATTSEFASPLQTNPIFPLLCR